VLRGMEGEALRRVPYLFAWFTCLRSLTWFTIRETRALRVAC
jgi:hypothetical protein